MFEILLAEDNPGDVLLFREALNTCRLCYDLAVAPDGQKAIDLLGDEDKLGSEKGPGNAEKAGESTSDTLSGRRTWRPDLIVLDVNLPRHNGDAVLRYVRRQPWLKGVPVIMLTSSASPADRTRAIDLGATLYLQKSSDLDELLEVGKIVEAVLTRGRSAEPQ